MNLNKSCCLRYFNRGKQETRKCLFSEYLFDSIPLYYSVDVQKADVIQFKDNTVLIIANNNFRKTVGESQFNIYIMHKILKIILDTENDILIDLHLAKWFSCNETLNYIKTFCKTGHTKEVRIKNIYNNVNNISKLSIMSVENMLKHINGVVIN